MITEPHEGAPAALESVNPRWNIALILLMYNLKQ